MKITVTHDHGQAVDITDGVRVLYDQMSSSMDWGSGFLDFEEVNAIRAVGYACGFEWIDYSLDICSACGHRVDSHRAAQGKRECRHGWRTRNGYFVRGELPGSWVEFGVRDVPSSFFKLPREDRRTEVIVEEVGCSCANYAKPLPVTPPEVG